MVRRSSRYGESAGTGMAAASATALACPLLPTRSNVRLDGCVDLRSYTASLAVRLQRWSMGTLFEILPLTLEEAFRDSTSTSPRPLSVTRVALAMRWPHAGLWHFCTHGADSDQEDGNDSVDLRPPGLDAVRALFLRISKYSPNGIPIQFIGKRNGLSHVEVCFCVAILIDLGAISEISVGMYLARPSDSGCDAGLDACAFSGAVNAACAFDSCSSNGTHDKLSEVRGYYDHNFESP